jgi:hypothetical protein
VAKNRVHLLAAGAAALATFGASMLLAGGSAALASGGGGGPTPPWESSIKPAPNGFITFYNSHGQVVTGGSITANGLAAYAVASTAAPNPVYDKATLFIKTPVSGENPALWSGEQISSSTNFPNTSAPAPVGKTSFPVETNPGTDIPISQYIAAFPNTQKAAGYVGLYDVRLFVSGGDGVGQLATYWDTVISVDTKTGTWSVDYPDWTVDTTTTLTASPPSPQKPPAKPVTLTATVAPATAGTVSFWSGNKQIGTTQTVTSKSGVAKVTTTPPTGTTPYQAFFTPAVGSHDVGSASATISYFVGTPSKPTLSKVVLSGAGKVGSTEDCTATATNATKVTYAWQSNGKAISGATSSTFTVPASLLGDTLTCSVTASNSFGSVSGTSNGVKIALGSALVAVTKPVISGPHVPGKAEKVTAGKWSPAASKVTYQWYIGKTKVKGATKDSFTVPSSAKGKTVHCVVTASATGYASGSYTTASVKIT